MNSLTRLIGLCLFCASGCAVQSTAPRACEESLKAFQETCLHRMEELGSGIREAAASPACTTSEQCKTAAVGAKACGGPQAYVPYSTTDIDEQRFLADVKEFNELSRLYTRHRSVELGVMSDCMLVTDPGAVCVDSHCALKPSR